MNEGSDQVIAIENAYALVLSDISRLVAERKSTPGVEPRVDTLMQRKYVESIEDGALVSVGTSGTYQMQYVERPDWEKEVFWVTKRLKPLSGFAELNRLLTERVGRDCRPDLERAAYILIHRTFENRVGGPQDTLPFLLMALCQQPMPSSTELDASGVSLVGHPITISLTNYRLVFRHVSRGDFEKVFRPESLIVRSRFMPPPDCIMRIEKDAWRGWELQLEAERVRVVMRLIQVCSFDFGEQTHETTNPFVGVGNTFVGGTFFSGQVRRGAHKLTLTDASQPKLQEIWEKIAPALPLELYDFSNKKDTHLTIAYERYCEGIFAGPIERKIAYAIMGLESLFFGQSEMSELSYRLRLRISKLLSKIGRKAEEVQARIKEGYDIRSAYVHGSQLSANDKKRLQKKGLQVEDLGTDLLDYLRITLLHLILSKQQKTEFLELIERSLVDRIADDELERLLQSEASTLEGLPR